MSNVGNLKYEDSDAPAFQVKVSLSRKPAFDICILVDFKHRTLVII